MFGEFRKMSRWTGDAAGMIKRLLFLTVIALTMLFQAGFPKEVSAVGIIGLNNNYGVAPTLDIFDVNLSPIASVDLNMTGRVKRLVVSEGITVKNKDGKFDLAFVGGQKEITIVDITRLEAPMVIGKIPMPGLIRAMDVDQDKMNLYVSGGGWPGAGVDGAFYIIDISDPFVSMGIIDQDGDGIDDRIIWKEPVAGINGLRVDTGRQLIYAGVSGNAGGRLDIFSLIPPHRVSGTITYTYYKATRNGLDYSKSEKGQVRGAIVELRDSSGNILESGLTDENGRYSFDSPPPNTTVRVFVKAALGPSNNPHVRIVDNTVPYEKIYNISSPIISTGTGGSIIQDIHAEARWDSATKRYQERDAAPFAILDTIYKAEKFILAVKPTIQFPPLTVNWSDKNRRDPVAPNNHLPMTGIISGAQYNDLSSNIYLMGKEDDDTDEYDQNLILHEWAHYFTYKFSVDDSIGGEHRDVDNPFYFSTAFSEGWAYAVASMILNDPMSINTYGIYQQEAGANDIESNMVLTLPSGLSGGPYAEQSIERLLWDLFDPVNLALGEGDNVHLDFKPLFDVMLGGQKKTPAFTSIISFLRYLIDGNPTLSSDIIALADFHSIRISAGDEYGDYEGSGGTRRWIYTQIFVGGTVGDRMAVTNDVNGRPLQTRDTYGPLAPYDPNNPNSKNWMNSNKLENWVYFKFVIPQDGRYRVMAVPDSGTGDLIVQIKEFDPSTNERVIDVHDDSFPGNAKGFDKIFTHGDYSMAVGSYGAPAVFGVVIERLP